MASLHKHPNRKSPFWYCKFRDFHGKVVIRSTKKTRKPDAWEIAYAWEQMAGGNLAEAQARRVMESLLERTGLRPSKTLSIREFADQWLTSKQNAKKPKTFERYAYVVREFVAGLGLKAQSPLTFATLDDFQTYKERLLTSGKSPTTINLNLKIIRTVFSSARKQGLVLTNPSEGVEGVRNVQNVRDVFTASQILQLVDVASPDWKTAILVGYYIGARLGDVVLMRWTNVDFKRGVIEYTQAKTEKHVTVPMHQRLASHLMALYATRGENEFLSPSLAVHKIGGRSGLSGQFAQIIEKAGIDRQIVDGKGTKGRQFSRLSFHSLRHSFASALANAGVSQEIRMKLTGHSNMNIHNKYTHFELEPLRQAIESLPSGDEVDL